MSKFYIFWDLDDTSLWTPNGDDDEHSLRFKDTIKNPHLLLPLLLFISESENCRQFILTNRSQGEDDERPPAPEGKIATTDQYLSTLRQMGICFHGKKLAGGAEREKLNTEREGFLKEHGFQPSDRYDPDQQDNPVMQEYNRRYEAKNPYLLEMVGLKEEVLDHTFAGYTVLFIDDLKGNLTTAAQLGVKGYLASGSGRPLRGDNLEAFYDTDYLKQVAGELNLFVYLGEMKRKLSDSVLKRAAAFIFGFQVDDYFKHCSILTFIPDATKEDLLSLQKMLRTIETNPAHEFSDYQPVAPMSDDIERAVAASERIENAQAQLNEIIQPLGQHNPDRASGSRKFGLPRLGSSKGSSKGKSKKAKSAERRGADSPSSSGGTSARSRSNDEIFSPQMRADTLLNQLNHFKAHPCEVIRSQVNEIWPAMASTYRDTFDQDFVPTTSSSHSDLPVAVPTSSLTVSWTPARPNPRSGSTPAPVADHIMPADHRCAPTSAPSSPVMGPSAPPRGDVPGLN